MRKRDFIKALNKARGNSESQEHAARAAATAAAIDRMRQKLVEGGVQENETLEALVQRLASDETEGQVVANFWKGSMQCDSPFLQGLHDLEASAQQVTLLLNAERPALGTDYKNDLRARLEDWREEEKNI